MHENKQNTYAYYVIKLHRSLSRAQKTSSMSHSEILFWRLVSLLTNEPASKKKDFWAIHWWTFLSSRRRSMHFYGILCICFSFLLMQPIHSDAFRYNKMNIEVSMAGERHICWFYQNEAWKAVRIYCHIKKTSKMANPSTLRHCRKKSKSHMKKWKAFRGGVLRYSI